MHHSMLHPPAGQTWHMPAQWGDGPGRMVALGYRRLLKRGSSTQTWKLPPAGTWFR